MQNTGPNKETPLTTASGKIDRAELEQAFSLFNEASRQLVEAYQELEQKVGSLTQELAVANGALRQQYEEKAALSSRLETLLEALPGGVVELDVEDRVSTVNPAIQQILGRDVRGRLWKDEVEPELVPTSVVNEWEYSLPGEDGVRRLSVVASRLPSGERILLVHDLSESWRLRQQLEQHKRLAAMGEMAAGLAHQLRTPLATALLYTANLTKPELGAAERTKFAEKSLSRLRHLETLVQNMLRFVRGQQAEIELVDLCLVIEDAFKTVQPEESERRRDWQLDLPEAPAWVEANHRELSGALINLLENAVQATAEQGKVALRLCREGRWWRIEVTDDGCGMSDAVKERLFEPFFTTRKEGTGLGLAIVRNLVTAYGGEIDVQSAQDRGTTFTILLPASR